MKKVHTLMCKYKCKRSIHLHVSECKRSIHLCVSECERSIHLHVSDSERFIHSTLHVINERSLYMYLHASNEEVQKLHVGHEKGPYTYLQ